MQEILQKSILAIRTGKEESVWVRHSGADLPAPEHETVADDLLLSSLSCGAAVNLALAGAGACTKRHP